MQYFGGKAHVAKKFAHLIHPELPGKRFVEPFVGGFNLLPALGVAHPALCCDLHPGLAVLYTAVRDGWEPPAELSKDEYLKLKTVRDWSQQEKLIRVHG